MYATEGDRRIFFDVHGAHTGWRDGVLVERPLILVVHGGPGFPHVYLRPWLAQLSERYCLVYLDLRGAGWSSRHPGSGYPLSGFVDDVELVRRTLGVERVVLLGHSFGGPVVMEYALAHPDRVSALVLASTLYSFSSQSTDAADAEAARVAGLDPGLGTEIERVMATFQRAVAGDPTAWHDLDNDPVWSRYLRLQFLTPPSDLWQQVNRNSHLGIEAYFMNTGMAVTDPESAPMASWDIRPRLPEIAAPTLVIGADSVAEFATPPHQAREIAAGIPNARLHIVPDKGHYFFAEDPTSLVAPVSEFLADIGLEGAIDDAALLCQAEPLR